MRLEYYLTSRKRTKIKDLKVKDLKPIKLLEENIARTLMT